MNPSESRELLQKAVIIASVTPEEHRKLGGIYTHFEELYREMLAADVSQLPRLGEAVPQEEDQTPAEGAT